MVLSVQLGCSSEPSTQSAIEAKSVTQAPDERFRNLEPDVAFVGDTACFSCHEDEYFGFKEHGMASSFYPLNAETAVESFGLQVVHDVQTGFLYRTYEADGNYYMEEYLLDASGNKSHRLVREMKYVMGSGTVARTYLTEENGWFYEMPVTWYTQARKWDLSPGYQNGNLRFDRKIADRCIVCHNSYPEPVPHTNGKYSEMPHGIGCERCHGPGALHVKERLAVPEPRTELDDTIVNPVHLSLDRRLDVCQQCHLNATVSLLREGRTPYDFRPSQDLADYLALFVKQEPDSSDEIGVISHADRMKRSACFLATVATGKPMECTTCHDPHAGFREQGDSYFNATCLSCHESRRLSGRMPTAELRSDHEATANCIECHMPRKDLIEAPHSTFTDHWIRVVKPGKPSRPVAAHSRVELAPYFERDRYEEGLPYEGMAYVTYGRQKGDTEALRRGIDVLDQVLSTGAEPSEAVYLHGFAYSLLGEYERAVPSLEKAVMLGPDTPERLNSLAQAYEATARSPAAIERLYRRALASQPDNANIRINYGRFLETRGRRNEAIAAYDAARISEPWNDIALYNLGTALLREERKEEARDALLASINLNPLKPEVWSNLGFLYVNEGDLERALESFRASVAANPKHPDALSNLGTYYLNAENLQLAVHFLERSLEANAQAPDVLAKLGLAHFRLDDFDAAREYAQRALDLDENNSMARQIISAI